VPPESNNRRLRPKITDCRRRESCTASEATGGLSVTQIGAFLTGEPPVATGTFTMSHTAPLETATHESIWAATAEMPGAPRISNDIRTDVCIVGGGIAGLTTAYLLTKCGKRVAVLEDGRLVSGMTQVTTAHLSDAIDDRLVNIERWHGEEGLRLAAESHGAAIDCIESIAKELNADCDFERVDGYLFRAPDDGEQDDILDQELAAAQRAGISDAEMVDRAPIETFETGRAIRFPNQARVHPLKYLSAVADAVKAAGGKLFVDSHADRVEGGAPARTTVGKHTVTSDAIVVATNAPINDLVAIHTKQAPYMTYVIGGRVPKGSVTDALYWDTLVAYHYLRLQPLDAQSDLLIVGGEDHKSGQADDADQRHARLEEWARERFPMMEEVEFVWGGQVMETIDGLAFIGRNPLDKENVYVVTGDSGMGITHGTIAGMLLTDLILGRENPWAKLYDPSRKTLRAAGAFVRENLNVAGQYTDWLTPGEVSSTDDIPFGSGAVLRRGMSKIAVYRDEAGKLTELSAVCPHLQCIVQWNPAESTWDCPCHGSRFRASGEVINGPANVNLPPADN
jgi:glycine/D-amino acid oxidase-like deaminating enzyme/nitrite reductase/ring-hydroxylating ferredoxin subunit